MSYHLYMCILLQEQITQQTKIMQTTSNHSFDQKMTDLQWVTKVMAVKFDLQTSWRHSSLSHKIMLISLFLRLHKPQHLHTLNWGYQRINA